MGHAPVSRDLGGDWGQPPGCECVLVALGEDAEDAGAIYEGQGMELLLTIGQTLAGTPCPSVGIVTHGITGCHQW